MGSLYANNSELLAALAILAPEGNVRVALVGLIDFLESSDDDILFDRRAIFEVIARGIIQLNFDMDEEVEEGMTQEVFDGLTPEQALEKFRLQLGTDEEEK